MPQLKVKRRFVMPHNVTVNIMAPNIDQAFRGYRIFCKAKGGVMVAARSQRYIAELNNAV
jgi:hypothetical protein